MPRQSRIDAPGALHHVVIRGIEKRTICQHHADYDFGNAWPRVAVPCGLTPGEVLARSKRPRVVEARSVPCLWTGSEFGMSATAVAKRLKIPRPAVSISVRRDDKILRARAITLTST